MQALQVLSAAHVVLTERSSAPLAPHEVRVRIQRVGLCGTDFALVQGTLGINQYPVVPGHEVLGVVSASEVPGLTPGTRVALDPLMSCGRCWACQSNHPQWCSSVGVIGVIADGGLQEEVVYSAQQWVSLPDTRSLNDWALIEPVHVACTALNAIAWQGVDRVLVLGSGALGLIILQILHALRPDVAVWVYDTVPERMKRACDLHAKPWSVEEDLTPDLVIDGVGSSGSLTMASQVVRPGGQVVVYGVPKANDPFDAMKTFFLKNVRIAFSRLYTHDFGQATQLIADGAVTAQTTVSECLTMPQAVRFLQEGQWASKDRWGKVLVAVSD